MKYKSLVARFYTLVGTLPVVIISLIATAVLVLIQARIDEVISPSGSGILYLQIAFSKVNFEAVLAGWGKRGIDFYLSTLWIDYL